MKKSLIVMLALLVALCAVLTSCATKAEAAEPQVEYTNLGLELKNKTEKVIVEYYLYETGSEERYNNVIEGIPGLDGKWNSGKMKTGESAYPMGYLIRPVADSYEVKVVFEDGSEMIIPEIELLKADSDGRLPNEISLKPDPADVKVQFDDDPEVQPAIDAAIAAGVTLDKWYPAN
ncbi:MAG: hypothetical protein IJ863_08400 [Spirochaetales bacterium]|nr:hypothetical protein [Spirochaetales bacterium]